MVAGAGPLLHPERLRTDLRTHPGLVMAGLPAEPGDAGRRPDGVHRHVEGSGLVLVCRRGKWWVLGVVVVAIPLTLAVLPSTINRPPSRATVAAMRPISSPGTSVPVGFDGDAISTPRVRGVQWSLITSAVSW